MRNLSSPNQEQNATAPQAVRAPRRQNHVLLIRCFLHPLHLLTRIRKFERQSLIAFESIRSILRDSRRLRIKVLVGELHATRLGIQPAAGSHQHPERGRLITGNDVSHDGERQHKHGQQVRCNFHVWLK